MRLILSLLLILSGTFCRSSIEVIDLNEQTLGTSFANKAVWIEDRDRKLTIEQILSDTSLVFKNSSNNIENLNFTKSGFWFRFSIRNDLKKEANFILETARPVTNKVILYQVSGSNIIKEWKSGDNISWDERAIQHRKCLFPLVLPDNNKRDFVLYLESDGEVITVPLIVRTPQQFMQSDYMQQLLFGLFYGVMFFVTIIYFFFFIALKEKSFLYYVLYVISMGMLQFSLDGFAYQFLFADMPFMADHFVMISACFGVFFVLLFGSSFLKLEKNAPSFYKIYRYLIPFIGVLCIFAFIPGPTYPVMYPLINIVSFFSLLLTMVTIIYLKVKKNSVDWFFLFAFSLLIVSIIIFILGNGNVIENPALTEGALKAGTGMEVIFLSLSLAKKYRELQEAKESAQRELLVQLEETNKLQANINIRLEEQVKERTKEITHQKKEIEEKSKEIIDSIAYAKRIQLAILPPENIIKETIPDSFILYKPRDIVSGDFYFVYPVKTNHNPPMNLSLFAVADCTGHGVPGAFMSILGNNILKAALKEQSVNSPADALNYLDSKIVESLSQSGTDMIRDGMDISLCALDRATDTLHFSGANLPVWIITKRNGNPEIMQLDPDKNAIGNSGKTSLFTNKAFALNKGDRVYIFSDGYADQFGGPRGKKLKYARLKEILLASFELPLHEQKSILDNEFEAWKGNNEQVDDVCLIGVGV